MKAQRKILPVMFLLFMTGMAFAQDVIVMKDQSTVISKVLEITSTEIKYKKWSNQDGPTYTIDRTEVLSINYENGEVEKFSDHSIGQTNSHPQQVNNRNSGRMEEIASFPAAMKLNSRRLTKEEVRGLVGDQNYQLFLQGKRQVDIGEIVGIIGVATGIVASVLLRMSIDDRKYLRPGLILGAGSLGGILGCVFVSINGTSKMHQVAELYNNNQIGNASLNLSPSLMRYEMPQSHGNCGLGLTLSMNF